MRELLPESRSEAWPVDGLEEAEVHWPGKGGKSKGTVWKCVLLQSDTEPAPAEEASDDIRPAATPTW